MYKKIRWTAILLLILITCGCSKFFADLRSGLSDPDKLAENAEDNSDSATSSPSEGQGKGPFKNGKRATKDDFIDQSQEEGSLWASSGQTNYYFTKNKVRSPGDIVTIKIENDLYQGVSAEIKKSLSPDEKVVELIEAKERLREKLMKHLSAPSGRDQLTTSAASPEKAVEAPGAGVLPGDGAALSASTGSGIKNSGMLTAAEIENQILQLSMSELDIASSLEIKNGDMMMGEIIGRYPNGNYKIRATKKVLYKKGQAREVTVLGIVKATDLGEDTDTVNSGKLYDYQVEVAH